MTLQTVRVVAGTETPVGEGTTGAVRCIVRFLDDSTRTAIVKQLPPERVAAEAFSALLLRGWGLCVPEPAIVETPLAFASIDTGYPNLKKRMGWSKQLPPQVKKALEQRWAEIVCRFSATPLALTADEAIENRDRNFENILWDGNEVAWIDHERALGVVEMPNVNKLAVMAQMSSNMDNVRAAAVSIAQSLGPQAILDASTEGDSFVNTSSLAVRVTARLSGLAQSVLDRFPHPSDLLSGARL